MSGTTSPLSALTPNWPTPCCSKRERFSSSSSRCVRRVRNAALATVSLSGTRAPTSPSGNSPAAVDTTSSSPCSSSIRSVRADTSARPRFATSSRMDVEIGLAPDGDA